MDNIWDRNPSKSKVIGRCVRDEKAEWPRRTDKVESYKNAFVNGVVGRGDSVAFILSKKPLTIQPIHNHKAWTDVVCAIFNKSFKGS